MRKEITALKTENKEFRKARTNMIEKQIEIGVNNETTSHEYLTDKEELARETDWIFKNRKKSKRINKKGKAESSPETDQSETVKPTEIKNHILRNTKQPKV